MEGAKRGTLLAPCPGRWPSVQCVCDSRGVWEGPGSSPNVTFHFHEALYSWIACSTRGALNSPLLVIRGVEGTRTGTNATNQQAWPLAVLGALCVSSPASPSPLFFGFVSQRGSLHRSAFIIVYGLAPKSFCLCSFAADKAGLL